MAVTTSLKRACLDDAYDAAKASTKRLRDVLRANETAARRGVAGGSLAQVGANGRSSAFALYGPGQVTPLEMVEVWRALIDLYDSSKKWLTDCATYGLDPDSTEANGFPYPTPAPVGSPAAVTDAGIYQWMMEHLVAVTSARCDFTGLRTSSGGQFL